MYIYRYVKLSRSGKKNHVFESIANSLPNKVMSSLLTKQKQTNQRKKKGKRASKNQQINQKQKIQKQTIERTINKKQGKQTNEEKKII